MRLKKNIKNNVITFLFGTLVALIIGEIFVSTFINLPSKNYRNLYEEHPTYGYKHKNNFVGTTGPIKVFTNSNGYRVLDKSSEKIEYNAISVGDSFIFGHLVKYDKIFQHLLENKTNLKILNAGVSGYNLNQSLALLQDYLLINDPDLIFIGLHMASDFSSQIDDPVNWIDVRHGLLFNVNEPTYIRSIRAFLSSKSNLYHWAVEINLKNLYHQITNYENLEVTEIDNKIDDSLVRQKKNLAKTDKIESYIDRFSKLSKSKAIFVLIPGINDFDNAFDFNIYNITKQILNEKNINYVDLREFFIIEGYKYEELILNEYDVHWNVRAHKIVSDAIYEHLNLHYQQSLNNIN